MSKRQWCVGCRHWHDPAKHVIRPDCEPGIYDDPARWGERFEREARLQRIAAVYPAAAAEARMAGRPPVSAPNVTQNETLADPCSHPAESHYRACLDCEPEGGYWDNGGKHHPERPPVDPYTCPGCGHPWNVHTAVTNDGCQIEECTCDERSPVDEAGWWHPATCSNQHDEGGNCLDGGGSIVGWREERPPVDEGLREAAQRVMDEWDTLGPTGSESTLSAHRALRAALASPARPEAYACRHYNTANDGRFCLNCRQRIASEPER